MILYNILIFFSINASLTSFQFRNLKSRRLRRRFSGLPPSQYLLILGQYFWFHHEPSSPPLRLLSLLKSLFSLSLSVKTKQRLRKLQVSEKISCNWNISAFICPWWTKERDYSQVAQLWICRLIFLPYFKTETEPHFPSALKCVFIRLNKESQGCDLNWGK